MESNDDKTLERCKKCNSDTLNDIEKNLCKKDKHTLIISTGNEDIDLVLTDHLLYCTRLVSVSYILS